jgi:cation diffusion facilitator family transporter
MVDPFNHSSRKARIVTWSSLFINAFLVCAKLLGGFLAQSMAMIADGLHSFTDIASDVLVLVGLKYGHKPHDWDHPYGHYRFSSLSEFCVGLLLLAFALGLILKSVRSFLTGEMSDPGMPVIVIAGASLVIKEILFWWTRSVARKTKSSLLMANAWHHRSDSVSSLLIAIALIVGHFGGEQFYFFDKLAAIGLSAFLVVQGAKIVFNSGNDLLDRAPSAAILSDFNEHILKIDGVRSFHQFRCRKVGDFYEIDVHIQVDPALSVVEAHEISHMVKDDLMKEHPEVVNMLVHIEPEG